ncbi:MAG: HPr family phosphocarrier protein [Candidatus Omnitrophica bacterium]|nr:HPr family phosphocarrier protein [Candidatus Omnitrophota bacterium]MCB9746827.1 HPr family phosphocarrier protein [Candidatus Omnitrophota bacterium]
MPRLIKEIIIKSPQGLHARPAALVVQLISKYNSEVTFQKDDHKINAKSIMGILTLGAHQNTKLLVEVDGDDAQKVIDELECLLGKDNVGE